MFASPYRRRLSVILSAVLLVGGTAPPVLRHSHAGGASPHRHDAHHAGHDHGEAAHSHGKPHPHRHAGRVSQGPAVHLHVRWLVFDLHLPASPHDEKPEEDRLANAAYVRLNDDPFTHVGNFGLPDLVPLGAFNVPRPVAAADSEAAGARRRAPLPPAPPLCDVARHERSGVLLA